jgi:N-methylhydantoinase A
MTNGGGLGALIGVDVGGTHTDAVVMVDGRIARGKALTTYDDFSRGVLQAAEVAAQSIALTLEEVLGSTELFVNGTTVVTNAITELRGANVGVLVTAGFKDTFRFAGGLRKPVFDDHLQTNVPDLVQRQAIAEIAGRVDYAGNELVALDRDQVRREARRLVEDLGVDTVAVCFLWSFLNPSHELAAREELHDLYPDMFVTLSHEAFPVQGENRRWTTAILNCFVHERAHHYLETLSSRLHEAGLSGSLAFFQGLGGVISEERAREFPLALLGSGPAAGAIGANELAKQLGHRNLLIADMGGTSLDTGIVTDNQVQIDNKVELGPFKTGVNIVDVVSIGAGGGSIAWIGDRGMPQVGPHSAGPDPGPACYGRGGSEPTVTDALVVMGFIDPDNYLGGRLSLRSDLAAEALDRRLGSHFGWTVEKSAAAVHELVVANMANAIRQVSVAKGLDPRDFLFLAYGGTLPLFAADIAAELEIATVMIPLNSSVFCARGLVGADFIRRYDRDVSWVLSNDTGIEHANEVAAGMLATAEEDMRREGFSNGDVEFARSADFRFMGQSFELSLPLPARELTAADGPRLEAQFREFYERTYGRGTAWEGVPAMLLNYTVTASAGRTAPPAVSVELAPRQPAELAKGERMVYLPTSRERRRLPVYDGALFSAGSRVDGPAIIDESDTTIYVPDGVSAERDEYLSYVLRRGGGE